MKTIQDIMGLIYTALALAPFLAAGYYFGRQDRKLATVEETLEQHDGRISRLENKRNL